MTFTLLCGRILIPYACSGSYTHNRVRHFRSFIIDYVPHMKRKIRCDIFWGLNVYSATPAPLVKCSPLMLATMLLTQRPTQHMRSLGIVCFCGDTKVKGSRKKHKVMCLQNRLRPSWHRKSHSTKMVVKLSVTKEARAVSSYPCGRLENIA